MLLAWLTLPGAQGTARAQGQTNFRPLERGDYTEVEEKLIVIRGLEVGADYALRVRSNDSDELPFDKRGTDVFHDLRLHLNTMFHRDVSVRLTLALGSGDFAATALRESEQDTRGRMIDQPSTGIVAREAYLRYEFNPNSAWLMGKHEVSLADLRGKVFHAIVPAFTFDCRAGTWCLPFGLAVLGQHSGDALFHIALQFNAWDDVVDGFRDTLQVAFYRVRYNENNIPLGKNLGPARFNPDDPINDRGEADPSQLLERTAAGQPIYYDADSQDYYGLRINWEAGHFFFNLDATGHRGLRKYHLYQHPLYGVTETLDPSGEQVDLREVRGVAVESEIGLRWETVRVGLRAMNASGDKYVGDQLGQSYTRGLRGYYEITPGSYNGTRLYFNGIDSTVELGGGLGHSINNTRMVGLFLDFEDQERRKLGYSLGLYQFTYNNPILNVEDLLVDKIGFEWDNVISWFVHKNLKIQFEVNAIVTGEAFRPDDYSTPNLKEDNLYQAIGRVVYSF
jgi:hypothetical protein